MKRWMFDSMRRSLAVITSLVTLAGSIAPVASQTPDTKSEVKPNKPETKPKLVPPPGNPLVLVNPMDGSGNAAGDFDTKGLRKPDKATAEKDQGNYRATPADPRISGKVKKELPFFGYDYFEASRKIILARRAYYMQLYKTESDLLQLRSNNGENNTPEIPEELDPQKDDGNQDLRDNSQLPRNRQRPQLPVLPRGNGNGQTLPNGQRAGQLPLGNNASPNSRRNNLDENADPRLRGLNQNGTRRFLRANETEYEPSDYQGIPELSHRRQPTEAELSAISAYSNVADPVSQLFKNVTASVPDNYQLSMGDKLTIRFQSPTLAARELTGVVDSLGNIDLAGLTKVNVRGLNLADAQRVLLNRLKTYYKNVELTINLKELRTITVMVAGNAFEQASYTLPSTVTAFTLLTVAGGPTEEGSLRRIEVRRQGRLIGMVDFYQMMRGANGKQEAKDIQLQSGDVLYIPPRESFISVTGEVRAPGIFELIEGETLSDALRYANGIKSSGVTQSVQINTVDPGRARILKNVDLKNPAEAEKYSLYDGDSVDVYSVRAYLANKVTVEGAVDIPGEYALKDGMRVVDLLEMARGPLAEAVLSQAELYRWNPDNTTTLVPIDLEKALKNDPQNNLALTRWDKLRVYTRQEIEWTGFRKVAVRGAVQRPGSYTRSENMRVMDLLRQVGGPTPDAHLDKAVLLHQRGDGTFSYNYFSISEAQKGVQEQNLRVEDNDQLLVYRVGEAQFTPDHVVTVRGSVQVPGVYPRGEGMKLSELLALSGGFLPNAGSSVVVAHARKIIDAPDALQKKITVAFNSSGQCAPQDDVMLEDGDVITVQGTGGFIDHVQIINVTGAVNKPGPIVLTSKNMKLSDAIREAGGLRPEAFPEGAEFFRDPKMLASTGQRNLAKNISELYNLLNDSDFNIELAKSDIARAQALNEAQQDSSPLAIPGLGGGAAPTIPNAATAAAANELYKRDLVTPPRELKDKELEPNGAIAVNLPEAVQKPGGREDILLVDGDTIVVPETPTTVQIIGAVMNPRGVLYEKGRRLDFYIQAAGGYAPDVAKDKTIVIRANGGTIPAKKIRDLRPGDVILVPTRVLAAKLASKNNALDSLFRSVTSSFLIFRLFGL